MKKAFLIFSLILLLTISSIFADEVITSTKGDPSLPPLKVIIIWHHHQPLYKKPGTLDYQLPWVRMHGINDYPYMAEFVKDYLTRGKVTFNITPVLLEQLKDYTDRGAMDKYMRISLKEKLSPEDKKFIREHFFDINPQFVNAHPLYRNIREKIDNGQTLTDQDYLDLRMCWNLYWFNIDYINADPVLKGMMGKTHYTMDDVKTVINKQIALMRKVIPLYKELQDAGKIEIMTTPYYHPILPLLVQKGWAEDAKAQVKRGIAYSTKCFGISPKGVWPSEEAISQAVIPILNESGVQWIVLDKSILQGAGVDTSDYRNLMRPYMIRDGNKSVVAFFRDSDLSNRLSFNYSSWSARRAVKNFLDRLNELQELNQSGDLVLTIALDGENAWEHYPNNGNDFRKLLYRSLSADDRVILTTPGEYLKEYGVHRVLTHIPTGSWAGDLSTWIGEKEENDAWDRLAAARKELFSKIDSLPEDVKERALKALYSAEGSDWFWWYGSDQSAGALDEYFDMQFKRCLQVIYECIGYTSKTMPAYLFIPNKQPAIPIRAIGKISPKIDGEIGVKEWANAGYFKDADPDLSEDIVKAIYVGRDNSNIYIRTDLNVSPTSLIRKDYRLIIYTDQPGIVNANTLTEHSERGENATKLGFPLVNEFILSFSRVKKAKSMYLIKKTANGDESWSIYNILYNDCAIGDTVEIAIPFTSIGVKSGQEVNIAMVAVKNGKDVDFAPNTGPVRVAIPQQVTGKQIAFFKDPVGDENGSGTYTYPKDGAFTPYKGLWDIHWVKVLDSGTNYVFLLKFGEMTNPWNAPKGFSHQLINIYLDTKPGGRTDTYKEGAYCQFDPKHPWDYFIKVAGWPSYGQVFANAKGEENNRAINIEADPGDELIAITVDKNAIGNVRKFYAYFLVFSQDGYGKDHIRAVTEKATQWTLGGYPIDSKGYASFVLDLIAPKGHTQGEELNSYDPNLKKYATVYPVLIEEK